MFLTYGVMFVYSEKSMDYCSRYYFVCVGAGLHIDALILGTIGCNMQYPSATISYMVNITSCMESLAKHVGASTLLSESTMDAIGAQEPKALGKTLLYLANSVYYFQVISNSKFDPDQRLFYEIAIHIIA